MCVNTVSYEYCQLYTCSLGKGRTSLALAVGKEWGQRCTRMGIGSQYMHIITWLNTDVHNSIIQPYTTLLRTIEFRSQSDLSVPGLLCGIRLSREGQSSCKATFSFIMAHIL